MRRKSSGVVLAVVIAATMAATIGRAQEKITFPAPIQADPGASEFRVAELVLSVETPAVTVRLRESVAGEFVANGRRFTAVYTGAEAMALLTALNTANLSVKSLQRRVIEKLIADGKVPAGTISGTPQLEGL